MFINKTGQITTQCDRFLNCRIDQKSQGVVKFWIDYGKCLAEVIQT